MILIFSNVSKFNKCGSPESTGKIDLDFVHHEDYDEHEGNKMNLDYFSSCPSRASW